MSIVTSPAVIRAIYSMGDRYGRKWPTAEEIAKHLRLNQDDVEASLTGLYRQRLFRSGQRTRDGVKRKEWRPWEEP